MNNIGYNVQIMNTSDREESLTLELLNTIEQDNDVTQRHLADRMGVALGLANLYLKRCVRKGLVKIHQAPANRYLYYLTPKGFTEKSRLTGKYLKISFEFYRDASYSLASIFKQCTKQGYKRIFFAGQSELAEIASIRAQENNIEIICIFDQTSDVSSFLNYPVLNQFDEIGNFDACIITDLNDPDNLYKFLNKKISKKRIFIPTILGLQKK